MLASSTSLNILFLPRWYPNRFDPMPGLFIQRQAEALSSDHHIVVLYVHPDSGCSGEFEIDYAEENRVTVVRVYYRIPEVVMPGIFQLQNMFRFFKAHLRGLEIIGDFEPDIIHSHILTRESLVGYYLSRRFRVPHVISEHWSRYFPDNGSYQGILRKWLTRYVVGKANAVIAVSKPLQEAMIAHGLINRNYFVVPNVVYKPLPSDNPSCRSGSVKQFLHVSCFDDRSKNISGLLQALATLSNQRSDFQCLLVGEGPDLERMKQTAADLGLQEERVRFTGLKTPTELDELYRESDFTVVSSRYETFGTVITESLANGTPVVSTSVGIAPEVINDQTGILVQSHRQDELVDSISRMMEICGSFSRETIAASVEEHFSPDSVSDRLSRIYLQVQGNV